jgi:hypothetical protein
VRRCVLCVQGGLGVADLGGVGWVVSSALVRSVRTIA